MELMTRNVRNCWKEEAISIRNQLYYPTHSQQIQHGHRVQQAASLETYTSHRAGGHSADRFLERVIEFMQQLVHVLHTSLLQ